MQNSNLFLAAFNDIENHLRKQLGVASYRSFSSMISEMSHKNRIIQQNLYELRLYADLRNAIVHTRRANHTIAEPTEETVREIQKIRNLIVEPPQVYPFFKEQVLSLSPENNLQEALKLLFEHQFSQCPVVRNGVLLGMLTNNSIVYWLGTQADASGMGLIDFRKITVEQVLQHQQEKGAYRVIDSRTNLAEAFEYFHRADERGESLQALFITHHGKPQTPLLGIITRADLPQMAAALGV